MPSWRSCLFDLNTIKRWAATGKRGAGTDQKNSTATKATSFLGHLSFWKMTRVWKRMLLKKNVNLRLPQQGQLASCGWAGASGPESELLAWALLWERTPPGDCPAPSLSLWSLVCNAFHQVSLSAAQHPLRSWESPRLLPAVRWLRRSEQLDLGSYCLSSSTYWPDGPELNGSLLHFSFSIQSV